MGLLCIMAWQLRQPRWHGGDCIDAVTMESTTVQFTTALQGANIMLTMMRATGSLIWQLRKMRAKPTLHRH